MTICYSELMSQVGQLNTLISLGQSLARATWGLEGTLLCLPGATLKETVHFHKHTELSHAGQWHMETWPGWLGKPLGTARKAQGTCRAARAHCCRGHPPRQAAEGLAR